ncbi:uncharacterized protein DSM5745_09142 [Aspergillus mulundensis]|uniref:Uncharacterized protein n=1 Tax=Aspergillus mulundensis TaxID=1810919 RepID=A0A3D8QZP7_9EURO|nr:hypothetical protein DSM5745_09142 [Aspergillus mulundensis]RDW67276.1 hypothetical protein DSM5745_09142 [Aspergillus mulundensis]
MSDIPEDQREHARDITINQDDPASSSGAYASDISESEEHEKHEGERADSSSRSRSRDEMKDEEGKGGIEIVEQEED